MKKITCLFLCVFLLLPVLAAPVSAYDFEVGQNWDSSILAGGIYDMYVWVGDDADDYTYQWQADAGFGKGHWFNLEDNADPYGYSGTKTYHLQLITPISNSYIIGTGWEDIPFQCVVTHKATGATRTSASMFMKVFTSDNLSDVLAEKGIELYDPYIQGAGRPTTTDDKTYYSTVTAGKQISLTCGYKPPQNDPFLERSEIEGDIEVWVTEDGKTVKKDNSALYTPYVIGKDAVTIEYRLHYTLGIHDMGYLDTKVLKLSTTAPDIVGRGTAKQEMSLLKEPYSQSQKLVTIPKGAEVMVHTNSGSWYQVSYRDYVGYVAGSSLNYEDYTPVIDHVNVQIAEPLAGNIPATSNTITPDSCFATSVEWLDLTLDRFMESGERFIKGHDYQLVIWASAKPGYRFKLDGNDNMLTTATINGNLPAYTSRAYEQIIGKVIDIRYDFYNVQETDGRHTCKPKLVERVEPSCGKDGHEAYYKCACGLTYMDANAQYAVNISTWGVIPAPDHTPSDWRITQVYHYKVCTTCGELLTEEDHKGGNATCLEPGVCTVCGEAYLQTTENHTPDTSKWIARGEMYHFHKCILCGAHCDIEDHIWSPRQHPVDASGHAYQCAGCMGYDIIYPHTPGPEATETDPQTCTECGYIITPAINHTHNPTKVPAQEATCTQPGSVEYYTCDGCSDLFADEACTVKLSDIVIEPTGHEASAVWSFDNDHHWQVCSNCNMVLMPTTGIHQNENGKCSTCDYRFDGEENTPQQTEPADPQKPADKKDNGKKLGWPMAVMIGLVTFGLAVTVTVIVLKKKSKQ